MDEVADYNLRRWRALARADALFTRPSLDLDQESARRMVDPDGRLGALRGKKILCLAGGGGQQSAAYGLLGASVTVVDLSPEQIERDRQAAAHYGLAVDAIEGDMRDLSALGDSVFDLVDQPYGLNFVPDARQVFLEVARVCKEGALYRLACANPFFAGMTERDWSGDGYVVRRSYGEGERILYPDQDWVHGRGDIVPPPQEFRHTLGALCRHVLDAGFLILAIEEVMAIGADPLAEPGSWDHFTAIAPPWLTFHLRYRPGIVA